MISIKNIDVSYGNNKVLKSLSLDLNLGLIHGIVGLNGSGKTTLLNCIYGLKKIEQGQISHNDEKLTKHKMAYLATENFFYTNITGLEYLTLFNNPDFEIEEWNKLFDLPLNDVIDDYSTGMKKKLAILGVLKQDKAIMILDEPFNGLDLETSRILRSLLIQLKKNGKTIIVTSHILETLTNLCDCIHLLNDGCFSQTVEKNDFESFEKELFQNIQNKNEQLISKLTL